MMGLYAVRLCLIAWLTGMTLCGPAYSQQAWKTQDVHITVNNFCYNNEPYRWIREEPGRFVIFDSVYSKVVLSAPRNEDGSVNASDIRHAYGNAPYKITVPAGNGPREFDLLDQRWVCRIRVVPTGAVR